MKYVVTLNGKKYEVEVEKGNATAVYAGPAEAAAPAPAAAPAEAIARAWRTPTEAAELEMMLTKMIPTRIPRRGLSILDRRPVSLGSPA